MTAAIAVFNAGSSSVKFSLYDCPGGGPRVRGQLEGLGTEPHFVARSAVDAVLAERRWPRGTALDHAGALDHIVDYLRIALEGRRLAAVGHRVVHGGLAHDGPARVDEALLSELQGYVPLAPLHQPHNLAPIRRLLQRAPEIPQVACFDTAFHRSQPEIAQMYALPRAVHEMGVRRFGFHGLSFEHIASQLPQIDPEAAAGRTVVLHLGKGASMCALAGGRSIASTMGFTAADGLMMDTRSGAVDPGVVFFLVRSRGMTVEAVENLLYRESGLLGVSGLSADMRTLLASPAPRAKLAIDLYLYRIRRELGALVAALGGLDALVFTGGIGENSAEIRARICEDARWLGVELDGGANQARARRVSAPGSRVRAWRLATDEAGVIARHAAALALPREEPVHA